VLEDNVARVQRAFEAINRRDAQAIIDEVPADFELHPLISVWERTYRGHDGIERWVRDLDGIWEEFGVEVESIRDVGGGMLLVLTNWRGRARGGNVELDGPVAAVIRFDGDVPLSANFYLDEARALAAIESHQ
jgi:hypothetical protein